MRRFHDPLAVDSETTGLRPFQGDRVIMASFADDTGNWAAPPDQAGVLLRDAVEAGRTIILHNGIFDRAVFRAEYGLEIPDDQVWDTMAVDWLVDENADHRLKEGLGARLFGVKAKDEKDAIRSMMRGVSKQDAYKALRYLQETAGVKRGDEGYYDAKATDALAREVSDASKRDWSDLTYDELHDYAVKDADLTWRIFWHQQEQLAEDTYVHPYLDRVHDICSLSYRINATGICVSEAAAEHGLEEATARMTELEGPFEGVNLNSPPQIRALLFDDWGLPHQHKTGTGEWSTDKDALEALSYDPRVDGLLEYRRLSKQVSAYYGPLLDRLGPDGRIHPTLHPCRTVTGRWSCSGPNLQTIPRESTSAEIRKVFRPAPGLVLTEWDLSQIEVRIAADMSQEGSLLSVYGEGGDVYQSLADEIGVSRDVAKTTILSAQYGVGPKTLSRNLARGTGEAPDYRFARSVLDRYWAAYPNLERLMKGLENVAKRRGYLPLWKPGRRRVFRSPHNPYPRYYTALNAAIQGGAAELMKDVLWEVQPVVADEGWGQVVLTVHDSIIIEHEPGAEDKIQDLIETVTGDVSPYGIATPWEGKGWK